MEIKLVVISIVDAVAHPTTPTPILLVGHSVGWSYINKYTDEIMELMNESTIESTIEQTIEFTIDLTNGLTIKLTIGTPNEITIELKHDLTNKQKKQKWRSIGRTVQRSN